MDLETSLGSDQQQPSDKQLHLLNLTGILQESLNIYKSSPQTFNLITLTLILPLSIAILFHSLITHPLINLLTQIQTDQPNVHLQWLKLFTIQFTYLTFLLIFSLISTAAIVFTIASLYTSKPASFAASFAAIPRVFKRLFVTFLFFFILIVLYHIGFIFCWSALILSVKLDDPVLFILSFIDIFMLFFLIHVKITALWHLASVVSVLEPMYGWEAMKKSRDLLRGKTKMAMLFVFGYLIACSGIGGVFRVVVVREWRIGGARMLVSVLVSVVLVAVLVGVNLVGLLFQTVFYYVCKSYHHQTIDKKALSDHLGGYLGDYVPLQSNIEMEKVQG